MFSGLHLQRSVLVHEKFRRLQPSPVGQLQGRPVHPSLCRPHRHATPHQQLQHCCALDPAQHARPCQPPKRESRAVQLARSIKYPRTIPGTNSIRSWTTWPWSPLAKGAFDEPRWSELECWAGGLVEPEYRDVRNCVRKAAVDWGIQTPKHGGEHGSDRRCCVSCNASGTSINAICWWQFWGWLSCGLGCILEGVPEVQRMVGPVRFQNARYSRLPAACCGTRKSGLMGNVRPRRLLL